MRFETDRDLLNAAPAPKEPSRVSKAVSRTTRSILKAPIEAIKTGEGRAILIFSSSVFHAGIRYGEGNINMKDAGVLGVSALAVVAAAKFGSEVASENRDLKKKLDTTTEEAQMWKRAYESSEKRRLSQAQTPNKKKQPRNLT